MIKKFIKKHIDYIKWLFRKPSIYFEQEPDIIKMVRDKNYYELRQYLPQYMVGKKQLSRLQSLLVLGGTLTAGIIASVFSHNAFPLLISLGVSVGTASVFSSYNQYTLYVCSLDTTHFVVAYGANASSYLASKLGTISGTSISYGAEAVIDAHVSNDQLSICKLDSTHFVVTYASYTRDTRAGHARVGSYSGTTISYGSEYSVASSMNIVTPNLLPINSTSCVLMYSISGSPSSTSSQILSISGTVITANTPYSLGNYYFQPQGCLIDSTHFLIGSYTNGGGLGNFQIATITGTAIAYGSSYVFSGLQNPLQSSMSVAMLNSTQFIFCWTYNTGVNQNKVTIGTISSGVISYGSNYTYYGNLYYPIIFVSSATKAVIIYGTDTNYYGATNIMTISGTSVSFDGEVVFRSSSIYGANLAMSPMDSNDFVLAFADNANSGYGTALYGTASFSTATASFLFNML